MKLLILLSIGLSAGIFSGLLGIGGGVILIPALVYLLGFTQHQAQGTVLAIMVPPIGILGAYVYYKAGFVDIKAALWVCLGFVIGGFIGAKIAGRIPDITLRKIFGFFMLLASLKMILGK